MRSPASAPANSATVAAVTATYQQLVACLNAGDYLRLYALYTDAYLIRTVQHGKFTQAQLQATPDPRSHQGARAWPSWASFSCVWPVAPRAHVVSGIGRARRPFRHFRSNSGG